MRNILAGIVFAVSLSACSIEDDFNYRYTPPSNQDVLNKKARAKFLERPIVKEFNEAGFAMDCELSICAQIKDAHLKSLQGFKRDFVKYSDRIKEITLTKEDYPHFDYRLEGAYLPFLSTAPILSEFFEVLDAIRAFEVQVGFRIEFPNNWHLKRSVFPLLQILNDNKSLLQAEAHRYRMLVVSSVYNRFFPKEKLLQLKIDHLRTSFSRLWSFMEIFFRAQDHFGSVHFDFDFGDEASASTMELMFQHSATFAPLFSKLQGRRISLFDWDFYAYAHDKGLLGDLMVSNSFDEKYLAAVFQDQIKVMELSSFVGRPIYYKISLID